MNIKSLLLSVLVIVSSENVLSSDSIFVIVGNQILLFLSTSIQSYYRHSTRCSRCPFRRRHQQSTKTQSGNGVDVTNIFVRLSVGGKHASPFDWIGFRAVTAPIGDIFPTSLTGSAFVMSLNEKLSQNVPNQNCGKCQHYQRLIYSAHILRSYYSSRKKNCFRDIFLLSFPNV